MIAHVRLHLRQKASLTTYFHFWRACLWHISVFTLLSSVKNGMQKAKTKLVYWRSRSSCPGRDGKHKNYQRKIHAFVDKWGEESLLGRYNRTVSRPTYILYSFRILSVWILNISAIYISILFYSINRMYWINP